MVRFGRSNCMRLCFGCGLVSAILSGDVVGVFMWWLPSVAICQPLEP